MNFKATHQSERFVLPSIYLRGVSQICVEKYIDFNRLFAQFGFSPDIIRDDNNLIDQITFINLLNEAAKLSKDELFGCQVGSLYDLNNAGAMGQMIANQSCIANIYPLINYLFSAENRGAQHSLQVKQNRAFHDIKYFVSDRVNCDQVAQLTVSAYFNAFKVLFTDIWQPSAVYYRQSAPKAAKLLETHYGCPVIFNADKDGIEIPASLIYQQIKMDKTQTRAMKIELAQILASCEDLDRLVASYIEFNLASDLFDKNSVAKCLGVHPRVLQNCLAEKGLKYQDILDEVRNKIAISQLKTTNLSVAQIAANLGYTESHTFVRAFKRWHGTTPLKYRKA